MHIQPMDLAEQLSYSVPPTTLKPCSYGHLKPTTRVNVFIMTTIRVNRSHNQSSTLQSSRVKLGLLSLWLLKRVAINFIEVEVNFNSIITSKGDHCIYPVAKWNQVQR